MSVPVNRHAEPTRSERDAEFEQSIRQAVQDALHAHYDVGDTQLSAADRHQVIADLHVLRDLLHRLLGVVEPEFA